MFDMGEDKAKEPSLAASPREVGVIRNQAAGISALDGAAAHSNAAQEPPVKAIQ